MKNHKNSIFIGVILIVVITIILSLFIFNKPKMVYFLIENSSKDEKEVMLTVKLNNKLIVYDTIKYSQVSPNYKIYTSKIKDDGKCIVLVQSEKYNISQKIEIDPKDETYVFINYKYDIMRKGQKNYINITQNKDTIIVSRNIEVWTTNEKPILH